MQMDFEKNKQRSVISQEGFPCFLCCPFHAAAEDSGDAAESISNSFVDVLLRCSYMCALITPKPGCDETINFRLAVYAFLI
jgi:hypothetical protein